MHWLYSRDCSFVWLGLFLSDDKAIRCLLKYIICSLLRFFFFWLGLFQNPQLGRCWSFLHVGSRARELSFCSNFSLVCFLWSVVFYFCYFLFSFWSIPSLHLPPDMILFCTWPFKINDVPLRQVNQSYVIGTSIKGKSLVLSLSQEKVFPQEGDQMAVDVALIKTI